MEIKRPCCLTVTIISTNVLGKIIPMFMLAVICNIALIMLIDVLRQMTITLPIFVMNFIIFIIVICILKLIEDTKMMTEY